MSDRKKIVILYSGGADSRVMMDMAEHSPDISYILFVIFSYGQKHQHELKVAQEQIKRFGDRMEPREDDNLLTFQVATPNIENVMADMDSNLLESSRNKRQFPGVHEMHVPGRNLIFISIAYGYAETMGCDEIWYGADFSDRENLFPDCYQEWVIRVNEVLAINGSLPVKLVAPCLGMTKELAINHCNRVCEKGEAVASGYDGCFCPNPIGSDD